MAITLNDVATAFRYVADNAIPNYAFTLAKRSDAGSRQIEFMPLGNILPVSNGERLVAVPAAACAELRDAPALEPLEFGRRVEALSASYGSRPVELLREVVTLDDGGRVLDYGGDAIEEIIWHSERKEFWLLVSFVLADPPPPIFHVAGG